MMKNAICKCMSALLVTMMMLSSWQANGPVFIHAEDITSGDITTSGDIQTSQVQTPYDKVFMADLLDKDEFKVNDDTITLTKYEKTNDEKVRGVVIKGKQAAVEAATFTIEPAFNFSGNAVSRLNIDALSKKGTKAKLAIYIDDETEPVATVKLFRQKKKDDYSFERDFSVDIYGKRLTGEHKVSFKISGTDASKPEVMIRSIEFVESSLPIIYFDIDESDGDTVAAMNASEDHSVECYGSMTIQVPDGYTNEYTSSAETKTYEMEYIRGRGNSTWRTGKNPYKVKLDKKADLLGMGENKHWVLLANYYDNSLLRNRITYWLGRALNMEFTPDLVPVDVVMNGEYYGSYFLTEQVRIGKTRVDIDDLEEDPTDETGGYLLGCEPYGDETNPVIKTHRGHSFLIERPEYEGNVVQTQVDYITDYVQRVEDAIYGEGFKNSNGESYKDLLDLNAAVYYHWIQEFSMNGDAYGSTSTYLYKKRNGKLYWGPLWDFDYVAWGSTEYNGFSTMGWTVANSCWNDQLLTDPEYTHAMREAWPNIKAKLNEIIEKDGILDQYAKEMAISAKYNFEKYGPTEFGWGFDEDDEQPELTYAEEIERLRDWITQRMAWVDANYERLDPTPCTVTYMVDGKKYKTQKAFIGREISNMLVAPEKKGYVFHHWNTSFHLTFEQYLIYNGYSESEFREYSDKETYEEIKKNGYTYAGTFGRGDSVPCDGLELEAVYVKESDIIQPKQIYLSKTFVNSSEYSDGVSLEAQITPFDAYEENLIWESTNENIATVDEWGYVVFVQPGECDIIVTTTNGLSAKCHVHIFTEKEIDAIDDFWDNDVTLVKDRITINKGDYLQIPVQYSNENGSTDYTSFYLNSLDYDIVETGNALIIHGVKAGTTLVYMTNDNGEIMACRVTVVDDTKPIVGKTYTVKGLKYKVLTSKTVECVGPAKKSIKKVSIPATVKIRKKSLKVVSIKAKAFTKCNKLTTVTIGKNVQFIKKQAFMSCKKLKKVTIGKGVEIVYAKAFYNCKKLKTITFKAKQMKINSKAFKKINKKAKIKVPKKSRRYYRVVLGKKLIK